jgi:tRNA pseudouridine38-40 synthase
MRVALRLEYDGTDYHGSQLQADGRTVQGELEHALETLFERPVRPRLASRTDAGVHAEDQVAAFDTETKLDMETVTRALNYHLADDLVVRSAQRVSDEFDPRRNAISREYAYTVRNGATPSPVGRRYEAHVREPLDARAMNAAARSLEGVRDFAAFAGHATPPDAATTRRMDSATVERDGGRVVMSFRANAFLNQQVRRMAGALVSIGSGKLALEEFGQLLGDAVRGAANTRMPAHGLCLVRIEYPESGPGALPA